jgi:hypothetical protein
MPFIAVQHAISVVPCRQFHRGCPDDCDDPHWGYRAVCACSRRYRGPRRPTHAEAEQDGLAHVRAKGQGR